MTHHYDGYRVETSWSADSIKTIAAIRRAIEIIENIDDNISIANQEVINGLRAALQDIRENNQSSYKGEF